MNLQDEITTEFLSWVLGEDVKVVNVQERHNAVEYGLVDSYGLPYAYELDTITRLIKEKCYECGYGIFSALEHPAYTWTIEISLLGQSKMSTDDEDSELEACILAGKWVMENIK